MTFRFICLSGFLALCLSCSVQAETVVYSDLGTGSNVYDDSGGWGVFGPASFSTQLVETAWSFTPESTTIFQELDVALSFTNDGSELVTVDLMSDANGSPGSILQSWNVSNLPLVVSCCTLQTLTATGTTPLIAGTTYWIAALPAANNTAVVWDGNSIGPDGTDSENHGSGWIPYSDGPVGAFEVFGSPEPSTTILIFSGILAVFGKLRRP